MLWFCILLPPLEAGALRRLGWWAQQWSSEVSCAQTPEHCAEGSALWLEIGASLKFFGGIAPLREQISAALQELAQSARPGIAPTPAAALLRARASCAVPCMDSSALQSSWRDFRLHWLALPAETLAALQASGLTRIDEVLALPMAALARRFGPEATLYLQRLQGLQPEPLPRLALPQRYRSRFEFAADVQHSTALLFPLQRLLGEFQGYLRARDRAVQNFRVLLEHAHHPATMLDVGLAQPGRAAAQLLGLVRERLERVVLPEAVRALVIEARRFCAPAVLQGDLFERNAEQLQQYHQCCDQLRARLGPAALQRTQLQADHRPEQAFRYEGALPAGAGGAPGKNAAAALPRPCWLLPEPQPLAAAPRLLAGPERIEAGWWEGRDCVRDYYIALGVEAEQLWVFRDLHSGEWYLHGLWS